MLYKIIQTRGQVKRTLIQHKSGYNKFWVRIPYIKKRKTFLQKSTAHRYIYILCSLSSIRLELLTQATGRKIKPLDKKVISLKDPITRNCPKLERNFEKPGRE